MDIERKEFPFVMEEKGVDPEARTFKGYFAVYGNFDGHDIIEYGAGKKTLKEQGHRVKVYWIHDFNEPIGRPLEIREVPKSELPPQVLERAPDATGALFVHGKLSQTRRGEEALTLMRDGVLDEGSIGYKSIKEDYEEIDGKSARIIKEYMLVDVSPVPLAMNVAAVITDVKVEETEDYIHVPAPGEEGKHSDHRIRTIEISEEQGIQARYCGECKTNVTYLFAKAKGWTIAKAVAWVKEHSKEYDKERMELLMETADEPGQGPLPATRKASREARLRLTKAKDYLRRLDGEEETGTVPRADRPS